MHLFSSFQFHFYRICLQVIMSHLKSKRDNKKTFQSAWNIYVFFFYDGSFVRSRLQMIFIKS